MTNDNNKSSSYLHKFILVKTKISRCKR